MRTVADLATAVELREDQQMVTTLGNLRVDGEAEVVRVLDTGQIFPLDEQAERALADFLDIPKPYLKRCPTPAKAYNMNLWIAAHSGAEALLEFNDAALIHVMDPDALVIPLSNISEILTGVFKPTDRISWMQRDSSSIHIDIETDHTTIVPWDERIEDRKPLEVGDITNGGVRIVAFHGEPGKSPSVQSYFTRLKCTNGLCGTERQGTINIKGQTVDQVTAEIEAACQRLLAGMDQRLQDYHDMSHRPVPGNPLAFAYQIGKERKVPARVMESVVKIVGAIPDEAATLYDIAQAFSAVANEVDYPQRVKLQSTAGEMVYRSEVITHRCASCQQMLDA